jgi:prepilin-type N-terminal cleavage/methylation domain-containing protein
MSSRFQKHNSCSGFTLAEVLVALAIASMLSVMLVRFAVSTRMNAGRVAEALQMATITEAVLERTFAETNLQPGRTDGRSGNFAWHREVVLAKFTTAALRLQEAGTFARGEKKESKSRFMGTERAPVQLNTEDSRSNAEPARPWAAYRVVITVEAPSGRKHVADAVTLRP